jgi:hypothetical protein
MRRGIGADRWKGWQRASVLIVKAPFILHSCG